MDLPFFTATPRRWHKRRQPLGTPPAPLTLVAAEYEDASSLTLTFDRAVDVSAAIVDFLAVKDGTINERLYLGAGTPLVISPTTCRVELIDVDPFAGAGITLTADEGNGIVAADDGAEWAGVTDLALPFP